MYYTHIYLCVCIICIFSIIFLLGTNSTILILYVELFFFYFKDLGRWTFIKLKKEV